MSRPTCAWIAAGGNTRSNAVAPGGPTQPADSSTHRRGPHPKVNGTGQYRHAGLGRRRRPACGRSVVAFGFVSTGRIKAVIVIRRAVAGDAPFLHEMLAVAADWRRGTRRPTTEVFADPALAHYVTDWPRNGDVGFIAYEGSNPVGAAWRRTFSTLDPGYGFIDEFTPELSIAVLSSARRARCRHPAAASSHR